MKKILQIISILVMCIFASSVYAKPPLTVNVSKGEARITLLEGKVQAQCGGEKDFKNLKVNDLIKPGCEVVTAEKSRMEVLLPDRSIVRFSENTHFKIMQADADKQGQRDVKIFVAVGKIWSNVRKALGGKSGFEVSCENAVAGVRGTIYRMNVEDDKSAIVKVYDGEVSVAAAALQNDQKVTAAGAPKPVAGPSKVSGPKPVSMQEWVYIVKAMQQINIQSNGKADEPQEFKEADDRDAWVDWNKARDNKI